MTRQDEIDRLANYMPIVVRSGVVTEWERNFCASIISKGRTGKLNPSAKQIAIMKRLVEKFQNETMRGDDTVIEREGE